MTSQQLQGVTSSPLVSLSKDLPEFPTSCTSRGYLPRRPQRNSKVSADLERGIANYLPLPFWQACKGVVQKHCSPAWI